MLRAKFLYAFGALLLLNSAHARDGDLDLGFSTNGKVIAPYPGLFGPVYIFEGPYTDPVTLDRHRSGGIALQSDGKLIVAASSVSAADSNNKDFGAMRLNTNGSIDSSFGFFGFQTVPFDRKPGTLFDILFDMTVQSDDSILIAGGAPGGGAPGTYAGWDMAITKLTASGQLDTAFGNSGKAIVAFDLGDTDADFAYSVEEQTDHKILLAGEANFGALNSGWTLMAIARLTPGGFPDTSFNATGQRTIYFGGYSGTALRARELAHGAHILVVGTADTTGSGQRIFALARLNALDGSLDTNFGTAGLSTYNLTDHLPATVAGDSIAADFSELPDGRLMVCGWVVLTSASNEDMVCMRFLANGSPDPLFSPALIPFNFGGSNTDLAFRMRRDTLGRFVLAGIASVGTAPTPTGLNFNCVLARLTGVGQLDTGFGTDGRITIDSRATAADPERDNGCFDVALQPDGKIVAAGWAVVDDSLHTDIEVARMIGDTIFADGFGP
jgi:uncharacterized delta-60 repeat protein